MGVTEGQRGRGLESKDLPARELCGLVYQDWFVREILENAGGLFEKREISFLKGRKRWEKLKSRKGRTKREKKEEEKKRKKRRR